MIQSLFILFLLMTQLAPNQVVSHCPCVILTVFWFLQLQVSFFLFLFSLLFFLKLTTFTIHNYLSKSVITLAPNGMWSSVLQFGGDRVCWVMLLSKDYYTFARVFNTLSSLGVGIFKHTYTKNIVA
jgi:hypothetical protein